MKLFLVLAMRRAQFDPAALPLHRRFLDDLRAVQRIDHAGPFCDGSGGAHVLRAADLAEAQSITRRDPAHVSGGWDLTVHEWQAH